VNQKRDWSDFWTIFFMPYGHFWFLQAIILIFALIGLLDRFEAMRTLRGYAIVLAGALAAHFFLVIYPSVFSSNQAMYLLPFFVLGLGANRFNTAFRSPLLKWIALSVFLVTMTLHVLACYGIYGEVSVQRTPLATAISISGLLTMLYWAPPMRGLAWIGAFSFTVYLYHVFFTGGVRNALHVIGVTDLFPNFVIGCIVGVAGPIVVELVVRKSAFLRRYFLGQS
jgi:surface polysaccharide O-acyltransferase-like enzyme